MRNFIIIFSAILMLMMTGCGSEQWSGVVYPDKKNILIQKNAGTFQSLEECKTGAMALLETLGALDTGFYECGKNCKNTFEMVCEEKMRGNLYK
ncbi:MAG: hypothetical protein OEY01_08010 [Desulfobulbaceae bacterium]|nr:hypothetical protein [Desulfobulbaceae bacterium]